MVDFSLRVRTDSETCPNCKTKLSRDAEKCTKCGAEKIMEIHTPTGMEFTKLLSLGGTTGLLYVFLVNSPRDYGMLAMAAVVVMAALTLYELTNVLQGREVPAWLTPEQQRERLQEQMKLKARAATRRAEIQQQNDWEKSLRGKGLAYQPTREGELAHFIPRRETDFNEIGDASSRRKNFDVRT